MASQIVLCISVLAFRLETRRLMRGGILSFDSLDSDRQSIK